MICGFILTDEEMKFTEFQCTLIKGTVSIFRTTLYAKTAMSDTKRYL